MKKFFSVLFFIAVIFPGLAQETKFVIKLRDKFATTFTLSKPADYLSQRSIQRRLKYQISYDSTDLPIAQKYLDSITTTGKVNILSTSKWLNQVLIQTTDQNALKKIQTLPFVLTVNSVGLRSSVTNDHDKFRGTVDAHDLTPSQRSSQAEGNVYDYGNNFQQVHIHEGEFLHNKGFRGENVQIAVLDAGFLQYKTITAFDTVRKNGQILGERDFVAYDNSVNEDDSHGMHCLSILSANWPGKMVGTAPKANYWLIRTEDAQTEYPIEEHNWVVGAEFADSTGSDLITSSLGYTTFDNAAYNHNYNEFYKNSATVTQGATLAVKKGMIVTVSAGNDGANTWKYISFPADADSVCTVGAVSSNGAIANFSSYGYTGKIKPNIVSIGAGTVIAGLNNQPVTGNGTSYSNPNVAGLIACLWQAFPNFPNRVILDAVYKSADKYAVPDNRFGFGLPNFKTAYLSLKHDENVKLYGNEWLFATPEVFTNEISLRLIGRIDGAVTLTITNSGGQVVANKTLTTEKEEVYNVPFTNLNSLPSGNYQVKYTDGITTRTINIQKGNLFEKEWMVALPNPFSTQLTVYIKGPETAEATIRLIDTKGSVVENITTGITQNETSTIQIKNAQNLAAGVYFLQYIGKSQKRTIRVYKGN